MIFNRKTGVFIPRDEPVFVLRAKDKYAVDILRFYASLLSDGEHLGSVCDRIADFEKFAADHPEQMKEPD